MRLHDPTGAAACAAAETIRHLEPGPLAALRMMRKETGAPAFWRLAARHPDTIGRKDLEAQWMETIRILAILTQKGDPAERQRLHNPGRRLGEVLCDGGDPSWTGPRPAFSERRLAQLMAARGPQRAVLLARAARALARSMKHDQLDSGVKVSDIAHTLLHPDDGRRLAEPYYRRLDRAERAAEKSKKGTDL